jgi:hypothetical protein
MAEKEKQRDMISIEEEEDGEERQLAVEALFDMEDKTYALLRSPQNKNDLFVMGVEDDEDGQSLIKIKNQTVKENVLDAYEIAVAANPAD